MTPSTKVYICHPWSDDPRANKKKIIRICRALATSRPPVLPIAPQLFLPAFMSEETERPLALKFCLELVAVCDLVLFFGPPTAGMKKEIKHAEKIGVPIFPAEQSAWAKMLQ